MEPTGPAASRPAAVRWGAATDVGRHRPVNQDSVLAERPLWVVADGMGGHAAGEVASQLALLTLREAARPAPGHRASTAQVAEAVRIANRAVLDRASADASLRGMGTTICALALVDEGAGPHLAVANVGDSRCYVFVDGQMTQVSRDHSYVEDLVAAGEITPAEALVHPRRHIVTRALGVEPVVDVDVWQRPLVVGERYLLCSDGLTNEVSDATLAHVLAQPDPPQVIADRLVAMANEAGGRDNITVLVVDVVDADTAATVPDDGGEVRVPAAIGGWLVGDLTTNTIDGAPPDVAAATAATLAPPAGTTGVTAMTIPGINDAPSHTTVVDAPNVAPATGLLASKEARRGAAKAQRRARRLADKAARDAQRGRPARPWVAPVRNMVTLAALAAIVAVVLGSIQAYGRAGWYVTFRGDAVTLFQGRPDGVLWVKPQAKLTYPATRTQLTAAWQDRIERRINFTSRAAADRWYALLSTNPDAAPSLAPRPTLPTTTVATTTIPTTTIDPALPTTPGAPLDPGATTTPGATPAAAPASAAPTPAPAPPVAEPEATTAAP